MKWQADVYLPGAKLTVVVDSALLDIFDKASLCVLV